ncbi:unnamed protein product [Cunninghamella blakesleeana]
MDNLSPELIAKIFTFLSHRYLATCSLVKKDWYFIIRQPNFYKTIELHSTSQIEKFVEFAQIVTLDDEIPIGHFVERIIFHTKYINDLNVYKLVTLINLCPFVSHINELPSIKEENCKLISEAIYWRRLSDYPLSYTSIDTRWLKYLNYPSGLIPNNRKNTITTISFDIEVPTYYKLSQNDYSELEADDERHKNILFIEHNRDCQLPKRFNDIKNANTANISFNSYYWKLPSSFANLKSLYLDFESYNKKHDLCYYIFNETTLESISTTCSSLTHLTFTELNFNLSDNYDQESSSSTGFDGIEPSPQLQYLYLQDCHLHEPGCYSYIQYKYPNLKSLSLYLYYLPNMSVFHSRFNPAIGDLITSYDTLTELKVHFLNKCKLCYQDNCKVYHTIGDQSFWPHKQLQNWLMEHPNQLTTLYYPFDLFTIEIEDDDWNTALAIEDSLPEDQKKLIFFQNRKYLNHLTTLSFNIHLLSKYTLKYLLYQNLCNQVILSSSTFYLNVEHLIVQGEWYSNWTTWKDEHEFFVYDWLTSLPSLKKLEIKCTRIQQGHQVIYLHCDEQLMTTPKKILDQIYPYYCLTELHITSCRIFYDFSEMTSFLKSLIKLKSLYLNNVLFRANPKVPSFTIFAPHLDLSCLRLSRIFYDQYNHVGPNFNYENRCVYNVYNIQKFKVVENVSNSTITKEIQLKGNVEPSNLWLEFVCHSVDNFYI